MNILKKCAVITLNLSLLAMPLQAFAAATEPVTMENVIITFKDKVDQNVLQSITSTQGKVTFKPEEVHSISATVPSNTIDRLSSYPSVKAIEKDTMMMVVKSQTQDWGIEKTNTPKAWNLNYTGKGIKVAVLDTGIATHSDVYVSGGVSFAPYTTSYNDDNGHGTHVAGIIGAENNDQGTVGVAPDAELYAVKVLGSNGSGYTSDIVSGIDWAIANNMDIINMSLGTQTESLALKDAVTRAINSGIVVVAAAGNDGNSLGTGDTVDFPARYDNVISVAAIDSNNNKAYFSSAGPSVDVAAPGVSIYSTLNTGGYGYMQGTSMASPYVAGVLALYKEAYPNYSATQLETLLKENAIDLGTVGKDNLYGYGLVQSPTVQGTAEVPVAPATPLNFKTTDVAINSISLSWDASDNAKSYELKRNGVTIYSGSNTSFVDSKLTQGTTYTYTVVAKNIGGNSAAASLTATTKMPALTPVVTFTATPSTNSVSLKWSAVVNATSYQVKRDGVVIYDGPATSFVDTGLTGATKYTYEVIAVNLSGTSTPTTRQTTTTPESPTNLVETHTSTTAQLTWNTVNGSTYYQVKNNKTGAIAYKGTNPYLNLSGLLSGIEYSFSVYAGNASGLSQPVSTTFTTTPTAPTTPILSGSSATQTSVTLAWKSIYNAKLYEVKRDGVTVYQGTNLSFVDSGLTPGKSYTYSIIAKNDVGNSASLTLTKTTIPATPTGLKGTPTTTSVNLSWNAVQGATYYQVKRNGVLIYQGPNTSFNNTALLSGTAYQYTILAGNASGASPISAVTTVTTIQAPPTTPVLGGSSATQTSVTLSWKSIYNAKSYEVKRDGVTVYQGMNLSFIDSGLTPGKSYTYTITAKNEAGTSSSLTVAKTTIPSTPTGLKGTPTTTSVNLSWNAVQGATYYQLKRNGVLVYQGTNTNFNNVSLLSGTAYQYTILAGNASGASLISPVTTVTTIQAPPTTPVLGGSSATQTSVTLSWKSIYNAKSYEVKRDGVTVYQGTSLSFIDSGLTPGKTYTYSITAKNEAGTSASLTVTKTTIPTTPTGLTGTPSSNSTSLSWNSVQGATYYVVKRNGVTIYQGSNTSLTNTGLLAATEYSYTVTAGNASGLSAISPVVKVKTLQAPPTTPYFSKALITNKTITFYWNGIYNAKSYIVKRNNVIVYQGTNLSFIDSGLLPGQTYLYSISASNEAGTSLERGYYFRTCLY